MDTIEVLNLSDGEIVNHPILLIRGRIGIPSENEKKTDITAVQLQPNSPQLKYLITPLSRKGIFKCLINLRDLDNDRIHTVIEVRFTLRYGKIHKTIYFSYERHENLLVESYYYKVQPLLIHCVDQGIDKEEQKQQKAIIDLNLQLVKSIYADRLRSANVGRKIFILNGNCLTFQTKLTCAALWQLNDEELWQQIAQELLDSAHWHINLKFIAFISCTHYNGASVAESGDYSYANIRKHLKGHVALGTGGLALFSTAHFYAWPREFTQINTSFNCLKKVDCSVEPDDSNYRRTYCGVYATTLGAVCHELGHIFNLGHTKDGVMGFGFDYVSRLFTIDTNTEALPERLFTVPCNNTINNTPRFTQLKQRHQNRFLDKYRKQQQYDNDHEDFYFTRNCAIILSYHKWFNNRIDNNENESQASSDCIKVSLVDKSELIVCVDSPQISLKLIEVRTNDNSLVIWYKEFDNTKDEQFYFKLPMNVINYEWEKTHLIAMTTCGIIQSINMSDKLQQVKNENDNI